MPSEEHITYCRICEPLCGLVATVQDGELVKLRPDGDHPLSKGFACPKGIAMVGVQNDPDRVTHPLRRRDDGSFEPVSWEHALDDIGDRLKAILARSARDSVGWYFGNPSAFSYSHTLWVKGFMDALGSRNAFSAGSQDVNNRFAASKLLYGSPVVVPIPDLARTDFLLIVGANPLVSHGSVLTAPRIKESLHAIVERGGRVIVVDPRRSETARAFEHVPIRPDADAWLLLSMLEVIFSEGLVDARALSEQAVGVEALRRLVSGHTPETTESRTGVPAPRFAGSRARWRRRAAPRSTAGPGRVSDDGAPSSRSCSTPSTSSPATSTRRAGRSSAPGRFSSRICCTASAPTATTRSARGSGTSRKFWGRSRPRSWPRRSRLPVPARSAPCCLLR